MSNNVDPDETAHYEPSHLDLNCLHRICFRLSDERVKSKYVDDRISLQQIIKILFYFIFVSRKYDLTFYANFVLSDTISMKR